jgi:CRISPR-associated protein Csx10
MVVTNLNGLRVPETFQVTLSFESDWHIGSGAGRPGDVDRLILRDHKSFPYVPAKTLTGIWRDACEQVAWGLDGGQCSGVWSQWVDYLFGDQPALATNPAEGAPRPAALSIRSAHLPESLQAVLCDRPVLQTALTFVKPGISLDPDSGCAIKDFLRFEEMVRSGAVLQAACELNVANLELVQRQTAYALLLAGTRLVERIGGKRRRGAGLCKLQVAEEVTPWIEWLANHLNPAAPPEPPKLQSSVNGLNAISPHQSEWVRIPLEITTQSPLTIPARTVGNVVETLDYIPGTYLLGMITRKLSRLGVDLGSAIAQTDLLVTNATMVLDGQPSYPTPLALFYEKLGGGFEKGRGVYNRLKETEPKNKQCKGYRSGYISHPDPETLPCYGKPEIGLATHNTIEDDVQRPTSDVGGVYSYDAISPQTVFRAELRLRRDLSDTLAKKKAQWWKDLVGEARIGQSKKDDYGLVQIAVTRPDLVQSETRSQERERLTIWLLSNVLIRDDRLRPTAKVADFKTALEKELGIELEVLPDQDLLTVASRSSRLDSWQVRWGLPRPSLIGLTAGSCMVFGIKGELDPTKLVDLAIQGIGERRAEGYGQLWINPPLLMQPTSTLTRAKDTKESESGNHSTLVDKTDLAYQYARTVEREAWRDAIQRACLYLASNAKTRKDILGFEITQADNGTSDQKQSKPPMSQLGALRSILEKLNASDTSAVTHWIEHIRATPNRLEKWSVVGTDGDRLKPIEILVTDRNAIWIPIDTALQALQYPALAELTLTQHGEQELKTSLWAEAVRTLVDACVRMQKRETEVEEPKPATGESN